MEKLINKLECVSHIQKHLGCRLYTLQQTYKGQKLADGISISCKGRLTDRAINLLQNYFGMAIGRKQYSIYEKAVLFYYLESERDERHHLFCHRSEYSWCKSESNMIIGEKHI